MAGTQVYPFTPLQASTGSGTQVRPFVALVESAAADLGFWFDLTSPPQQILRPDMVAFD